MRYRLDYISPWTAYTVDWYDSLEECEQDVMIRFEAMGEFKRDKDGVLRMILSYQDNTALELHEMDN